MRRRTTIAIAAVVLVAVAVAIGWWRWPLGVQTARPTRGPAIDAVYATGVVEPTVMVPVAPRSGGRLAAIQVAEGASVRRGQVLARIESADLEQTVQEMEARVRLARTQYERTRDLVAQKFISPAELDRTRTELEAAQAGLRRAQAQRDYNLLVAPADGVVLRRDGEPGQFIPAGQTVITLACCAPLRVSAEVDEEDIARVAVGQKVAMRTDALPNQLFDGEVAEITPKGDPVSRSYRVRIRLGNAPAAAAGPLRTGMTMDTNIIVARREAALLVPSRALKGDAVWVLSDGRLHRREVRKGVVGSERVEILSGLAEGDTVVLDPPEGVREDQRARASSAASAASTAR
ncbi:MAG: efflux RND transporter periplasmic adaptor subunit [Burkholderiaceae bacterium]|nr:efflux RND transporter periplasmic adaptor subunit [Burkholderiaceae bacterium]